MRCTQFCITICIEDISYILRPETTSLLMPQNKATFWKETVFIGKLMAFSTVNHYLRQYWKRWLIMTPKTVKNRLVFSMRIEAFLQRFFYRNPLRVLSTSTFVEWCWSVTLCIRTWPLHFPDSKVHGANMGPIWGREDPGGPHVGPMNFAIWVVTPSFLCILKILQRQSFTFYYSITHLSSSPWIFPEVPSQVNGTPGNILS